METYFGYIDNVQDALLIIEAARNGILHRAQHRLTEKERRMIRSGSIFVWDESEAGMRRWTDGRAWSPSRVSGCFLNYRELEHRRRGPGVAMPYSWISQGYTPTITWVGVNNNGKQVNNTAVNMTAMGTAPSPPQYPVPTSQRNRSWMSMESGCTSKTGFRYKMDGLVKRTISVTVSENRKLHLISYFRKRDVVEGRLRSPRQDSTLSGLSIPPELYPDVIMVPTPEDEEEEDPASPTALRRSPPTTTTNGKNNTASQVNFTEKHMPMPVDNSNSVSDDIPSTVSHSEPVSTGYHNNNSTPVGNKLQHRHPDPMTMTNNNNNHLVYTHKPSMSHDMVYGHDQRCCSPPHTIQSTVTSGKVFVPTPSASPDLSLYTNQLGGRQMTYHTKSAPQPHAYGVHPIQIPHSNNGQHNAVSSSAFFSSCSNEPVTPSEHLARTCILSPLKSAGHHPSSPSSLSINLPSLTGLIPPPDMNHSPVMPSIPSAHPTVISPLSSRARCDEDCRQLDAFRSRLSL